MVLILCIITISAVINISVQGVTISWSSHQRHYVDSFVLLFFSAICAVVLVVVCLWILNEAAGDTPKQYGGLDAFVTVTWLSLWALALIRFGIAGYMAEDLNYRPLGAYLVSSLFAFLITPPSSMEVLSGSVIPMVNETVLRVIPHISMIPQFDTFAIFTLCIILVSVPPTLFSDEGRGKTSNTFAGIISGMSLLLAGMWQLGGSS